ncbi:response regulator [Maribellus comscasis]|uniref:Response regulator n=1 Tax=Maribellus comscasis TaxID=2681766 RepID=A0A6I6K1K8_9BACT|nr:LytTR family DNA-binding domain-containing protein [Maribellus comscasis]QGY47338.1 response regulator [Maribellus comscasis]
MIRTVIVEDEKYSVLNLQNMLKDYAPDIEVTEVFSSGKEALSGLPQLDFDLLFLDIQFNDDFDAFRLLESLQFEQLHIIFVTSYNQYALKAFKYNAIDYITKPIDGDDLVRAIKKARQNIFKKNRLDELLRTYNAFRNRQIVVKGQTETNFIFPNKILYIKAEKEYSTVVYFDETDTENELLTSKHLGFWENELLEFPFLRVHKSYLVNMEHIKSYGKNIKLDNGSELAISRDRRKEIHLRILQYKTGK